MLPEPPPEPKAELAAELRLPPNVLLRDDPEPLDRDWPQTVDGPPATAKRTIVPAVRKVRIADLPSGPCIPFMVTGSGQK
jgi:hypothetical protein